MESRRAAPDINGLQVAIARQQPSAISAAVLVGFLLILSQCRAGERQPAQHETTDHAATDQESHRNEGLSDGDPHGRQENAEEHKNFYREQEDDDTNDEIRDSCKESQNTGCQESPILYRLRGEKVGHVQEMELVPGKKYHVKTINMKPVIFEIADFFTSEECRHIISLAKEHGFQSSSTTTGKTDGALSLRDINGDQRLSLKEMQLTIEDGFDTFLDENDIKTMYSELGVDLNQDDYLSRQEVNNKVINKISSYVRKLRDEKPIKKSRYSEQTWIYPDKTEDPLVASFQDRILKLTQLPQALIDKFSYFQVVHYGKDGHYNAHHDSSVIDDTKCCHLTDSKNCRICRYMTIMVYLNDVEGGGETAFPVANNDTYSTHAFRQTGKMDLNARCNESNLKVRPEQGKAVIWYNHFVNETTGWLGDIDPLTWHGGCPVTKGNKWIMNRWISVSNSREVDLALP